MLGHVYGKIAFSGLIYTIDIGHLNMSLDFLIYVNGLTIYG
jgi:hypothetical protein